MQECKKKVLEVCCAGVPWRHARVALWGALLSLSKPVPSAVQECEKKVLEVCCALPVGVDKKGKPAPPTVCKVCTRTC